jgi:hypothetical protein
MTPPPLGNVWRVQAWEYFVIDGKPLDKKTGPKFMADLEALGRQGWEAVSQMPYLSSGHCQVLLKRPI